MFLDAHCEVGPNWLPPLLTPIYDNPKTLTVPVIDGIQWDDFSINPVYAAGAHSRGMREFCIVDVNTNFSKHYYKPHNVHTNIKLLNIFLKFLWVEILNIKY